HASGKSGKVQRSLARRIRSPHNEDLLADHRRSLDTGRAIKDSSSHEPIESRNAKAAVTNARRENDRTGDNFSGVGEAHYAFAALRSKPGRWLCKREVRTEQKGLLPCPEGQFTAAESAWKTEIVANHRAGAGLPAQR